MFVLLLLPLCCCQADGHCLYRSLEDQLDQTAASGCSSSGSEQQLNYQELRELAAEYIREHKCVGGNPEWGGGGVWLPAFPGGKFQDMLSSAVFMGAMCMSNSAA